jgi:hypothetical protein
LKNDARHDFHKSGDWPGGNAGGMPAGWLFYAQKQAIKKPGITPGF